MLTNAKHFHKLNVPARNMNYNLQNGKLKEMHLRNKKKIKFPF